MKFVTGEGAAGKVYQCLYKNDPIHEVQFALKKMDISGDFDDVETINGEEPRCWFGPTKWKSKTDKAESLALALHLPSPFLYERWEGMLS